MTGPLALYFAQKPSLTGNGNKTLMPGIAALYDGIYTPTLFGPANRDDLLKALRLAPQVVTFQGTYLAYSLIYRNQTPLNDLDPRVHIDIFLELVREVFNAESVLEAEKKEGRELIIGDHELTLPAIARSTLGQWESIPEGADANSLIESRNWPEAYTHCLKMARIILRLFRFGQEFGYLLDGEEQKIPIDFNDMEKLKSHALIAQRKDAEIAAEKDSVPLDQQGTGDTTAAEDKAVRDVLEFLTTEQASRLTAIPKGTFSGWRSTNQGPQYFKFKKRVMYRRADLIAWMESGIHKTDQSTAAELLGKLKKK